MNSYLVIIKMGDTTGGLAPQDIFPKAKAAVLKALQLDNNLGEAYTVLGSVKLHFEWDLDSSEQDFKRALELDPQNTEVLRGYYGYLLTTGRFDENMRWQVNAARRSNGSMNCSKNQNANMSNQFLSR